MWKSLTSKAQYLTVVFILYSSSVLAEEYRLQFVPNPSQKIDGLVWDEGKDTKTPLIQTKNGSTHVVKLRGKFTHKTSNLLLNSLTTIALKPDQSFEIEVPIKGERTPFLITSVSPSGEIAAQTDQLLFPDWLAYTQGPKPKPKKFSFAPGLGVTYATYSQTGTPTLNELLLTLKVSGAYQFHEKWNVSANVFGTVAKVFSTPSSMGMQFLGANLRVGYSLLKRNQPWELILNAGGYYATSFATGFGYHDLIGPQLYPTLKLKMNNNRAVWVYAKYSPLMSELGFINLNNVEMAAGGGYALPVTLFHKKSALLITLDVALLTLQAANIAIQSNTYTLGCAYGF